MIQKEDYKELREELEKNLKLLDIPKYTWHWPELLYNTLLLLDMFIPPFNNWRHLWGMRKVRVRRALEIVKEIYE